MKVQKSLHLDTAQPATRRKLYRAIRALPVGTYAVDLTRKKWRVADGQRNYYWGYLVVEVSRLTSKGREEVDKIMNALFLAELWVVADQPVTVVRSLSDLDPVAASKYFEDIVRWVWATYQVRLSQPDPAKRKIDV